MSMRMKEMIFDVWTDSMLLENVARQIKEVLPSDVQVKFFSSGALILTIALPYERCDPAKVRSILEKISVNAIWRE